MVCAADSDGRAASSRHRTAPSVLFASHTPETGVFRVGSHHLSRALARAGWTVGHISTPVSSVKLLGLGNRVGLGARWRSVLTGPQLDDDDRMSAVPFTALPVQLTGGWARNAALYTALPPLHRTVRAAGANRFDTLLIDQPLFAGLERLVPAGKLVYRPTDVYTSPGLLRAQRRMLARADAVVATSPTVLDSLPAEAGGLPSLVLTNGVDAAMFGAAAGGPPDRPAAVYVGALDGRIDWIWLAELAGASPGLDVDLYGPADVPPTVQLPGNVHLRGAVPYAQLPELLAGYPLALLPFRAGEVNAGRSPMKLFEYLAAGLSVLATPHFAQGSDQLPGVHVHAGGAAAAGQVRELLNRSRRNDAGAVAAGEHDWSARAEQLGAFLQSL